MLLETTCHCLGQLLHVAQGVSWVCRRHLGLLGLLGAGAGWHRPSTPSQDVWKPWRSLAPLSDPAWWNSAVLTDLIAQMNFKYTILRTEQWRGRKGTINENHTEGSYKSSNISILFLVHLLIFNIGRPKRGRKVGNSICKLYSFPFSSFNAIPLLVFFYFFCYNRIKIL